MRFGFSLLGGLIKFIVKSFGYTLSGVLFAGLFCIFTETGSQATLTLINRYTDYQIKYQSFSGRLADKLIFSGLEIAYPDFDLNAKQVEIHWNAFSLLTGSIEIEHFRLDTANITAHAETPLQSSPIQSTQHPQSTESALALQTQALQQQVNRLLPLPVRIHQAQLSKLSVNLPAENFQIETFTLHGFDSQALIALKQIEYKGNFGFINAHQNDIILAEWELKIAPETFKRLNMLNNTNIQDIIYTKGNIKLNTQDIYSERNILEAQLKSARLTVQNKSFENVHLQISGSAHAHQVKLEGLYEKRPTEIKLTGRWENHTWKGQLHPLTLPHVKFKQLPASYGGITVTKDKQWHIDADLQVFGQTAKTHLNIMPDAPYSLKGKIQATLDHPEVIKKLFPELNQTMGTADAELRLTGYLFKPTIEGKLNVQNIAIDTAQYGTKTTIEQLTVTKKHSKPFVLAGHGNINARRFELNGTADFVASKPTLSIHLTGENLIVSQTPEYYIVASPDLQFIFENNQPTLKGKIYIPDAHIKPIKTGKKAALSSDVVIVNAAQPAQSPKERTHPVRTDLEITLGPNIQFEGSNFTSTVTGKLKLNQKPHHAPQLTGEINLTKGKYKFQGKTFNLTHGKLVYSGTTLNNPLLDIEAKLAKVPLAQSSGFKAKQPTDLGIRIKGKLSDPKINFFSTPAMAEADIISYLVLGRPQHEATEAQAEMLYQAITQLSTLFGPKGNDLSFNLADRLKLDHIGFSKAKHQNGNSMEDTVLTLGKQLSSRLYMNYSLGLYDSANQIGLQYHFNKNLSIEAQTGKEGSSADLIFSFDS